MAHLAPPREGGATPAVDPRVRLAPPREAVAWWVNPAVIALALALWEALVRIDILPRLYFPPPTAIGRRLFELFADGTFTSHGQTTLYRMGFGLVVGTSLGFLMGVAMGRSQPLRRIVDPIIGAVYP